MPANLLSQKNIIIAVVFLFVLGGGYYFFAPDSSSEATTNVEVNRGLLAKNIVTFLGVKDKIDLKDSAFLTSVFYNQLIDYSEVIEMSPRRGRDNPFIPYAASRSIR